MNLRTQPIKAEGYSLAATEESGRVSVRLTGTFDMTATTDLSLFLVSIEGDAKRLNVREIVLDVVEVYYLGSSCIKSFVTLVEALKKHGNLLIRVVVNPRLDWQDRTFAVLSRLAPALVVLEKGKG
jgi:anti-anti-sigma regulatory factor